MTKNTITITSEPLIETNIYEVHLKLKPEYDTVYAYFNPITKYEKYKCVYYVADTMKDCIAYFENSRYILLKTSEKYSNVMVFGKYYANEIKENIPIYIISYKNEDNASCENYFLCDLKDAVNWIGDNTITKIENENYYYDKIFKI